MPRQRRLYDDSDAVSGDGDAFRCRRSDGKKWRCRKRAMDDLSFCEYHYVQIRANLERHKASAGKPRNRARKAETPAEEDPIAAAQKRRRVKRAAEKEEEEEEEKEARTTRVLPNGLMTIATTSPAGGHGGDEGGSVGPKVGFEEGRLLTRRRIRSKNAEPIPVATIKKIPCGRKRICHSCREKNVLGLVRCLSCRKTSFCSSCLKKRYSGMLEKEVKTACPVCRGCCDCKACSSIRPNDGHKEPVNGCVRYKKGEERINCHEISQIQEPTNDQNKYKNTEHAYKLISQLLPLLKNIYLNQLNELEIVEPHQEVVFSGTSLQVDEPHNEIVKCNCCRIPLVDFHRSCTKCSYKLCLSCYLKVPKETASPAHASDSPNEMKQILSMGVPSDNSSLSTIESGSKEGEQSLSCPHTEFGGCGNGLLKLNFIVPFCRSKELRKTVEDAAAFSSDCGLHPPPCCSDPLSEDQKIGQFTISL